jgi:cobalt-zinc-cadmium resistance protein CzcA
LYLSSFTTGEQPLLCISYSVGFCYYYVENPGLPANLISMGALDFGLLLEGTLCHRRTCICRLELKAKKSDCEDSIKFPNLGLLRKAQEVWQVIFSSHY